MGDVVPYQPGNLPAGRGQPGGIPPVHEGYPDPTRDANGVREYLGIIRRQLWVVLGIAGICTGIAAWLVLSAPPTYRAVAVARFADARQALTGGNEGRAYDEVLGREADVLLSQIQVMMSRQIASNAVDGKGLRLMPVREHPYPAGLTDIQVADSARPDTVTMTFRADGLSLSAGGQTAAGSYGQPVAAGGVQVTVDRQPEQERAVFQLVSRTAAIENIRNSFKAAPRPKTDIIDIQFVSQDPQYSQRVANAMALTFQQYNTESSQQASRRRRIFLEEQMRQTAGMLESAMNEYSSFRSGRQVFSSREKASAQQAGIVEVEIRRADLDAQRRTYRALLAQAQRSSQGDEANLQALVSSPGIASNPVIQNVYRQLTGYQERRDSLLTSGAAATNPDVIAATTLISTSSGRLAAAVRNQLQALDAQIDALDNLKAQSTAQIAGAPQAETEEARLAQQVQAVQAMSDKLQEDYQRARMIEAVEAGQVEIVDLAEVPEHPIAAGRVRKLTIGLLLGLLLGFGAAVMKDGMNTSIRRRDDLERILQVPGLAVIPQFASANGRGGRLARALPRRAKSSNGQGAHRAAGLVTIHDARSSGAEAYRTLRTNLIFSQAVQTLRTLVVTSAAPSEGKTTTAANLAVSFAQQGMRVLIVDCDLRRSRLHRMFSVPREPGVTELVLGQVEQDTVVRETSVTGLYVLASGQLPPNPAELLGGERMRATLASLSEAFDLIVLDTPPLLAASDAAILGTIVDGVVLVVRAGVTEADAGQQAIQQLTSVGARVVGAVLNDPDSKLQTYGGYYKYEYARET
ncbi:MAG: polysaccharide biosynthesis tyrosine autokinase [Gemmatimonadaceae bacterium]